MREKNLETCLVTATGLILLWFIYELKALLIVGFIIGIIGLFLNPVANWVTWLWYKIADVLGFIVPKILLSTIFFFFLFPLAVLYRLFNKDGLQLDKKGPNASYWIERGHKYDKKDLDQIW